MAQPAVPLPPVPPPTMAAIVEHVLRLADGFTAHMAEVAARHDLTAQQARVLRSLERPQPMGMVAGVLRCDPSNVTGLIDRIARRGLVERTHHPSDKRVRLLALTAAGREVREALERELVLEAAALTRLDGDEAAQLVALLARVGTGGSYGCTPTW